MPLSVHVLIGDTKRLAKLDQFTLAKITPIAARNVAELKWTDPGAHELENWIADLLEHASDNPVAPFVKDDPDNGPILDVLDRADRLRLRALTIDKYSSSQAIEHCRWRVSIQLRLVFLVDLEARMHDAMRHEPVVR